MEVYVFKLLLDMYQYAEGNNPGAYKALWA